MWALCPWDRSCWPFGTSSDPIKKFSTFKVKGFLMFTLLSQRFQSLFHKSPEETGDGAWDRGPCWAALGQAGLLPNCLLCTF